jgi:hypothetical protein
MPLGAHRYRPLMRNYFINPVLCVEFEDIHGTDRSFLQVVNHDSVADLHQYCRGAGRVATSLGVEAHPFQQHPRLEYFREFHCGETTELSRSWGLGYALGFSRPLALQAESKSCVFCRENFVARLELRSRTDLQLFSAAESALRRRHTMQACQVRCINDPVVRRDWIPGRGWGWLKHVQAERNRVNPFVGQPEAIAAGGRVFEDHRTTCHRPNVTGRAKRPSLRSDRVQRATDGKILAIAKRQLAEGYAHPGGVARADALADERLHQEPGACHARRCSLRCC